MSSLTSAELPALLSEPRMAPFTSTRFDVATFVSKVLAGSHTTAQAQSEALKEGVRELDGALAAEVMSRNKELLTMVRRCFPHPLHASEHDDVGAGSAGKCAQLPCHVPHAVAAAGHVLPAHMPVRR